MKRFSWIAIVTLMLSTGCQSSDSQEAGNTAAVQPVVNVVETDGPEKAVARLAIEGMGCEMACGGAIKKALGNLDGVVITEIDFDSEKETDYAIVEFDDTKVSGEQMVETVSGLRKGQYNVSAVTIEKHVAKKEGSPDSEESSGAKQHDDKQIDTRTITVPNILDILNGLIVRS